MNPVAQREAALARANEVRLAGAAVRREIGALGWDDGRRQAARHLLDPSEGVLSLRLDTFLRACRHFGPTRARWTADQAEIGRSFLTQPVRRLTHHQRQRLAVVLYGRGA